MADKKASSEAPKPDSLVYGLYECYAATATVDLQNNHIYHDLLISRDDEHAVAEARRKSSMQVVKVTRIMDVVPV